VRGRDGGELAARHVVVSVSVTRGLGACGEAGKLAEEGADYALVQQRTPGDSSHRERPRWSTEGTLANSLCEWVSSDMDMERETRRDILTKVYLLIYILKVYFCKYISSCLSLHVHVARHPLTGTVR